MSFRISRVAAALAVLGSGGMAPLAAADGAAGSAADQSAESSTVIVRESRVQPIPVASQVGDETMQTLRPSTSDTASLLRGVPGVQMREAGGVSSLPVLRGLADDRNRIVVDGMDLISSCPNHMNPPLSYLDPTGVGKLRVVAGVTPVSIGGDSIGGTIIAESLAPRFASPGEPVLASAEIGAFYRSNGNARGGNLSAGIANDNLSASFSAAIAKADNYTAGGNFKNFDATGNPGHTLARDEVGSSAYEARNYQVALAYRQREQLVEFKYAYQDIPEQLFPNQRMDMLGNTQNRFNLRYLGEFDWGQLEARAYYETVDHLMDFGPDKRFYYGMASGTGYPCSPISATCAAGMPMKTESRNTGVTVRADVNLGASDLLRVGGLYQHYWLDDSWPPSGSGMWPQTFENINDGTRDRLAIFGEWESRLDARWTTLLGLRYERVTTDAGPVQGYDPNMNFMGMGMMRMYSNQQADAAAFNAQDRRKTDNNWDLTALARYAADAQTDLEFGVARKTRSPNLYERYTWSTWSMAAVMNNLVGDGNGYYGNVDLNPEVAYTVSASVDWHAADRSWRVKATPYYTRVNDYIDAIRCSNRTTCAPPNATTTNQFVVLQYANQSAELYGIDLSGELPLAATRFGDFALNGVISYTYGKNLDTGDGLYNIMPFNARLVLTERVGGWDNALEFVGASAKNHLSDVRNEIGTPGYGLVNLRTSYSWKQARIDFGVENLFDKLYYLPLGGAYTGQGTTMMLNGVPWGIAVPGVGRSIYAGVSFKL
ncbi:TonB-dependent receptor [Accumulibacter sp.]|uniref:TonB-dependent receptor n=1 Tax=Accumulibacter sp. TaxID=2053492 RepID=UPI0025D78C44|nr:TonB-dependent receptor [Accumulibacter sp.]MCM8594584.1 TonB-dependent receptor [Accumulibacter sp.]MCM8627432.1 TonB-dependent receptor [Accumulibacter sp.]MDS4048730.1 TonB-dependent receptor [Accumulibacter sp.]